MSKKHGPGPNLILTRILALLFLQTLVRQVRTQKVNPAASGKSLIKKTLQTLSFLPLSSLTHSKLSLSLKPSPNPSLLLLLLSLSLAFMEFWGKLLISTIIIFLVLGLGFRISVCIPSSYISVSFLSFSFSSLIFVFLFSCCEYDCLFFLLPWLCYYEAWKLLLVLSALLMKLEVVFVKVVLVLVKCFVFVTVCLRIVVHVSLLIVFAVWSCLVL